MFKKNLAKKHCHTHKKELMFNQDPAECLLNSPIADSDLESLTVFPSKLQFTFNLTAQKADASQ